MVEYDEALEGVRINVLNQFGDAESALKTERDKYLNTSILSAKQCADGDYYYEPPIPFDELVKLLRVNSHHGALPSYKAQLLVKYMKPNKLIDSQVLMNAAIDDGAAGNAFFRVCKSRAGKVISLDYLPMVNMRRVVDKPQYLYLNARAGGELYSMYQGVEGVTEEKAHVFDPHEVIHIKQHDPVQEIYGVPHWIGAMQSILLAEDVRIFPRLFFKNGGSTGDFILTSGLPKPDQEVIEKALYQTKDGNRFKRVLLQFPRGSLDEVFKSVPYSSGAEKIDYSKLADLCVSDVLAAWRVRPELAGMSPAGHNTGDLEKIRYLYHVNEIVPMQQKFANAINQHLPKEHWLEFNDFESMPINNG